MINKDLAYKKISELVARFEEQYDFYKKSDYNETQTRRDFIDPFFFNYFNLFTRISNQ
jgi:adenine-specific DNA-methyltransferase